jgi:hypothetical protein
MCIIRDLEELGVFGFTLHEAMVGFTHGSGTAAADMGSYSFPL